MVGFGSLMVASHRGIFSLGFLLSVGVVSILLASLTVLPALLLLLSTTKKTEHVTEVPEAGRCVKGSLQLEQSGDEEGHPLGRRRIK
jgi:predicted RND superfamily exporter protein